MGYRSEVAYVIRFANKEMRQTFINIQRAKADPYINEALNEVVELEEDKLAYHAYSVKWYESYEAVQAHENLMHEALELFNTEKDIAGYRFIRIGEEYEDVVVSDNGDSDELWEYLDVHRSINVAFQTETWEHNQSTEGETA
jgi:hypothetical protein